MMSFWIDCFLLFFFNIEYVHSTIWGLHNEVKGMALLCYDATFARVYNLYNIMFLLGMTSLTHARPDVAIDLWRQDNQTFGKESYELKIIMILTATVCFFLVIIYVLFSYIA